MWWIINDDCQGCQVSGITPDSPVFRWEKLTFKYIKGMTFELKKTFVRSGDGWHLVILVIIIVKLKSCIFGFAIGFTVNIFLKFKNFSNFSFVSQMHYLSQKFLHLFVKYFVSQLLLWNALRYKYTELGFTSLALQCNTVSYKWYKFIL